MWWTENLMQVCGVFVFEDVHLGNRGYALSTNLENDQEGQRVFARMRAIS